MTKRPTFAALGDRLAKKDSPQGVASEADNLSEAQVSAPTPRAPGKKAGAQPDGRKGVLLRLKPDAWLQLKGLAAEETLKRAEIYTMQSALEEALNDFFRKHGKPPLA